MTTSELTAPASSHPVVALAVIKETREAIDATHPVKKLRMEEASTIAATTNGDRLRVKLLSDKARAPTKGSVRSAGWDVYSARTMTLEPHAQALIPLDISVAVPPGTYGRLAPRSGLALKHFIDVGAGVVDEDYRGPLGVVIFNFNAEKFEVKEGDRVAQLILEKISPADLEVVESLEDTERGAGGFGSTGGFTTVTKVAQESA